MEFINTLKDTPVPSLLLIGGLIFLFMGIATIKKPIVINVAPSGRKIAFVLGIILVGLSVFLFSRQILEEDLSDITPTLTPSSTEAQGTEVKSETATPSLTATILENTPTRDVVTASTNSLGILRKGPQPYAPYVYAIADERPEGVYTIELVGKYHDWFNVKAPDGQTGWLYKDWLDLASVDVSTIPASGNVPTPPATPTEVPPPTSTFCLDPKCFP